MSQYLPLRRIERTLLELDESPLLGSQPPIFPRDEVVAALKEALQLPDLAIEIAAPQWRTPGELLHGLGEKPLPLTLTCAPIETSCHWVIGNEDLRRLMRATLQGDAHALALNDEPMKGGFHRFLALEVMAAATRYGYPPGLSLQLGEEISLPKEAVLAVDVAITAGEQHAVGRVLMPIPFVRGWRQHYTSAKPNELPTELWHEIEVALGIRVGHTALTQSEWASVNIGDYVVLDQCSPDEVDLTLEGRTLFGGLYKGGKVEITQPRIEKVMDEEEFEAEEEELSLPDEPLEEEVGEEEEETPPPPAEPAVGPGEIPVTLTVEMGRLKMAADKLLSLQPGNLLDLEQAVDAAVDLRIGGKRVGRGELLQIGDTMGVRILEIG